MPLISTTVTMQISQNAVLLIHSLFNFCHLDHSPADPQEGMATCTMRGREEVITSGLIQGGLGGHLQGKDHGDHTLPPRKEGGVISIAEINGVGRESLKMKMIMNFEGHSDSSEIAVIKF